MNISPERLQHLNEAYSKTYGESLVRSPDGPRTIIGGFEVFTPDATRWETKGIVSVAITVEPYHPSVVKIIDCFRVRGLAWAWTQTLRPEALTVILSSQDHNHPPEAARGQPKKCVRIEQKEGQLLEGLDVDINHGKNPNADGRYNVRLVPLYRLVS